MVWSCVKGQTGVDDDSGPVRLWCVNLCSRQPAVNSPVLSMDQQLLPFGWIVTSPEEKTGTLDTDNPAEMGPTAGHPISESAEHRLALDQVFDSDAESDSDAMDHLHSTPTTTASESNLLASAPDHISVPQSCVASEVSSSIGEHYLRYG